MKLNTMKNIASTALLISAGGLFGTASAHVVLEYQVAPAGASYKAAFKVGHGCGASPTRQVVVDIPAGMRGARPMPKAGWTLEMQRDKLAQPYTSHGRSITEDVVRVTWTAKTADDMLQSAHRRRREEAVDHAEDVGQDREAAQPQDRLHPVAGDHQQHAGEAERIGPRVSETPLARVQELPPRHAGKIIALRPKSWSPRSVQHPIGAARA
mgnify:CR=1 FL=1